MFAAAPDMLEALSSAEDLLGFHEGSETIIREGGHPVIWINNEDFKGILSVIRSAIAKATGKESQA